MMGRICIIQFGKEDTSGVRFVMWSCRRRSCTSAGSEDVTRVVTFFRLNFVNYKNHYENFSPRVCS